LQICLRQFFPPPCSSQRVLLYVSIPVKCSPLSLCPPSPGHRPRSSDFAAFLPLSPSLMSPCEETVKPRSVVSLFIFDEPAFSRSILRSALPPAFSHSSEPRAISALRHLCLSQYFLFCSSPMAPQSHSAQSARQSPPCLTSGGQLHDFFTSEMLPPSSPFKNTFFSACPRFSSGFLSAVSPFPHCH